ncbi:MAG: MFS transporter [Myxococcota bacterium]
MTDDTRPARATALSATLQAAGGGLGWSLLPPLMPTIAEELGISRAAGGLVWGAAPPGIALASPLGGAAVDRWGARKVAGVAMLVGAVACALRALANGPLALAVLMFLFGLHIGFVAPAIPRALAGHVPVARLGRANGLALHAYTVGAATTMLTARTALAPAFGGWRGAMAGWLLAAALGLLMLVGQAGGFVLPVLVGAAAQHGGFSLALVVLSATHLLILVPGLRLAETGRGAAWPAAPVDFGGAAA